MLHAFGDVDDIAGIECNGWLAPFLIPTLAADADEDLADTVVYVPIIAATGLEGDIAICLYGCLARREVFWSQRRKIAAASEVASIVYVWLAFRKPAFQG